MVHIVNVAACHAAIFFCRCDANRVADADIACEDGLVLRARPKRVIAGDAQTAWSAIYDSAAARSGSRSRRARALRSQASAAGDITASHGSDAAGDINFAIPRKTNEGELCGAVCNGLGRISNSEILYSYTLEVTNNHYRSHGLRHYLPIWHCQRHSRKCSRCCCTESCPCKSPDRKLPLPTRKGRKRRRKRSQISWWD